MSYVRYRTAEGSMELIYPEERLDELLKRADAKFLGPLDQLRWERVRKAAKSRSDAFLKARRGNPIG